MKLLSALLIPVVASAIGLRRLETCIEFYYAGEIMVASNPAIADCSATHQAQIAQVLEDTLNKELGVLGLKNSAGTTNYVCPAAYRRRSLFERLMDGELDENVDSNPETFEIVLKDIESGEESEQEQVVVFGNEVEEEDVNHRELYSFMFNFGGRCRMCYPDNKDRDRQLQVYGSHQNFSSWKDDAEFRISATLKHALQHSFYNWRGHCLFQKQPVVNVNLSQKRSWYDAKPRC